MYALASLIIPAGNAVTFIFLSFSVEHAMITPSSLTSRYTLRTVTQQRTKCARKSFTVLYCKDSHSSCFYYLSSFFVSSRDASARVATLHASYYRRHRSVEPHRMCAWLGSQRPRHYASILGISKQACVCHFTFSFLYFFVLLRIGVSELFLACMTDWLCLHLIFYSRIWNLFLFC